ncbi:2-oxo acid dehydrogenase subunit E2 [Falsiroseomonas selenitidurans]|uniref:Dihydrolipoamide acetyltransferase component of pyruvate dehydrogenase complex n=1 Tax=Falsiroseomonas selenitidurans TaxID=2716335 RepID=A0ABX1E981_9PROT|nr:2-oxo acid dehydrogenase subunit E2 [Falsiroseomonas selenitidurans]NKC33596.1 pyruvate dehydrogenase complex dihydrolipoamide acetyltransferase [Falsiroseomonas selenitidurans]
MNTPITMPTLSDTMETGRLVKWTKAAGDPVKKGDAVAEVETDKAVMDVEAFHDGFLAGPLAALNTDLPVGQVIGYIADAPAQEEAAPAKAAPAATHPKAIPAAVPAPSAAASLTGVEAQTPKASKPAALAKAAEVPASAKPAAASRSAVEAPATPVSGNTTASSVHENAAPGTPTPQSNAMPVVPGAASPPAHVDSSPLARRAAEAAGVSLAGLHGSGPHGRIVAADVEAARHGAPATKEQAVAAPVSPVLPDDGIRALYPEGSYDLVPHDAMRRIIAARLVQSSVTIPHFQLTVDCDIGALLTARHGINRDAPLDAAGVPLWDLSINDFVIKALAVALQRVPAANAIWTDAGMLRFRRSDIGVAVAIDGGLITPVVREADAKSLSTLSNEVKALAARARARKLKPAEYQGGVSTVSNLGMRGIREFTALINPPQSSILAVGVGEQRPVGRDGQLVLATMMTVTLSCDHRVVDGALGAELIEAVKALIENPVMMAV